MICKVLDDNGYIFLKTKLPAVVCVLKGINEPRIPTITGVLKAQKYIVKILDSFALGVKPEKCGLLGSPTRVKRASAYEFNTRSSTDITNNYIEILSDIFVLNKRREDIYAEVTMPVLHSAPSSGDIWVASEITGGKIADVSLELLSKAKELTLASNKSLSSMIFNPLDEAAIDEARAYGVDTIMYSNDSFERFDETYVKTLVNMCKIYKPAVLLFGSTTWGKWVAPYAAVKLQTGLTADCIELRFDEDCDDLIQTRIAFGGNILADIFTPNSRPQMATVRKGVFKKVFLKTAKPPQMIYIGESVDMSNRI
jgi:hypothetical protein